MARMLVRLMWYTTAVGGHGEMNELRVKDLGLGKGSISDIMLVTCMH